MKEFISSYEDYVKFTSNIQKNQIVNILFTGKKDDAVRKLHIHRFCSSWLSSFSLWLFLGHQLVSRLRRCSAIPHQSAGKIWKRSDDLCRSWRWQSVRWSFQVLSYKIIIFIDWTTSFPFNFSETWKTMDNPYRKDKNVHLQVIPTLVRWANPQRLEGDQLLKDELLQMFFCDEDWTNDKRRLRAIVKHKRHKSYYI